MKTSKKQKTIAIRKHFDWLLMIPQKKKRAIFYYILTTEGASLTYSAAIPCVTLETVIIRRTSKQIKLISFILIKIYT